MKKLIEVSLKSIIFFIGWAIFVSVIPIPDIDNTALWRFFAELIPFLAIVIMTVIFWFVDRKKTKLHLTQRPVYRRDSWTKLVRYICRYFAFYRVCTDRRY